MPQVDTKKLLILIPCYNEAGNLEDLVLSLRKTLPNAELLILNDGSTDSTRQIANALSTTLDLPYNIGIGGAVQAGFKYAFENQFSACIRVDGDGQHPAEELPQLLKVATETNPNLLIGSRFLKVEGYQSTVFRRLGISLICRVLKRLTGFPITDPTSGFCYFDKKAIELFKEDYPFDFPEPVSILIAKIHGLKVAECSVKMLPRKKGVSSISALKAPIYMLRVIFNLFFVFLRRAA